MRANFALLREQLQPFRCWAVVKANAYGHGLDAGLLGFEEADGLALIEPAFARYLREKGWRKPILLMEGIFDEADLTSCVEARVDLVVHDVWQLKLIESHRCSAMLRETGVRLWIKFNGGMNRLGFLADEGLRQVERLHREGFGLGVIAHFANADALSSDSQSEQNMLKILKAVRLIDHQMPCSFANSAASHRLVQARQHRWQTLRPDLPEALGADWLRLGIALYGASAFDNIEAGALGLSPVMRLESRVLSIQSLKPGDRVGYGGRFVAQKNSRIAIIAGGYADGYPRQAPDGTPIWIAGHLCPLAGRVSMDMITADVSDHPQIQAGDLVELWGERLSVDRVAAAAGTIGYQLLSGLTERVPRRILKAAMRDETGGS
ncbi:MAG: alanine racemase [Proteobacteria bacterium]|jgi:alanine racemase|nr:alanine racemase [Pseudomonadota bacterium]